jgi:hypothetical protein
VASKFDLSRCEFRGALLGPRIDGGSLSIWSRVVFTVSVGHRNHSMQRPAMLLRTDRKTRTMGVNFSVPLAAMALFELSDADFTELERAGGIKLSPELRERLQATGEFWTLQLAIVRSPRPKQVRESLKRIVKKLRQAHEALDLNRPEAPEWDGQLLYWLQTVSAEGEEPFFEDSSELLKRMERMIQRFERLVAALPKDAGRRRPYDDQRFLSDMTDIFGCAGGKPVAYWSEYSEGMADTAFRRFVHAFYRLLPIEPKRTAAGLDEALRDALSSSPKG